MANAQEILAYTFLAVIALGFAAGAKKGGAAYAATLGENDFKYSFESKKMPIFLAPIAVLMLISVVYGLLVSQNIKLALEFTLATTLFGALGLILMICYIPNSRG
ncbi:MAG TPA: hypothetical protein VIR03_02620 [Candidatus Saccharimonadales bacterium]